MRLSDIARFAADRRDTTIDQPERYPAPPLDRVARPWAIHPMRAGAMLLASDIVAYVCAFLFARVFIAQPPLADIPLADRVIALSGNWHSWGVLLIGACLLLTWSGRGHYTERLPWLVETWQIVAGTIVTLGAACTIKIAIDGQAFNFWLVAMWLLAVPIQLALRRAAKYALAVAGWWRLRTLLVGDVANLEALSHALASETTLGYDVVRHAPLPPATATAHQDFWPASLELAGADFVIVAIGSGHAEAEQQVIDSLTQARIRFAVAPHLSGFPVRSVSPHYFFSHDVVLIVAHNNLARPISRAVKMLFDMAAAASLLLLLAPLLIAIAIFVKADGGPILFAHERLGAGGRRFPCLKFRTMVVNSQEVLQALLASDPGAAAEWHATQKLRQDPRVTPIGRFLRSSSLDELPQLFNVLAGQMSLVGPRPIVQAEVARYDRDIGFYYAARPGVTGLWQVSGRSDTSYAQRVRLDVWYVKNWSLWHDLAILLKTVPALLSRRGAV